MMTIEIAGSRDRFQPGETVEGNVEWQLEAEPNNLELRLFWFTQGKGNQDVEVIRKISIRNAGASGRRNFAFVLPEGPYSFSGKLISLVWAIELVSEEPEESKRFEFVVSPTGQEVII